MLPSKSREHRLRVLENQAKLAADRDGRGPNQGDSQLKIPLLVEVKHGANTKQPKARRARRKSASDQPDFEDL
jgi:hypothetical protein